MKHQLKAVAIFLFAMQAGRAAADSGIDAVHFACSSQSHTFDMAAISMVNVPELRAGTDASVRAEFVQRMQAERDLYIQGGNERDFEFRCDTKRGRVLVKMHLFPATETANCGLFPGGRFDLMVNGRVLVKEARWNIECAPSITKLTLEFSPSRPRATVGICGNPTGMDYDVKECCLRKTVTLPVKATSVVSESSLRLLLTDSDTDCHDPTQP